MPLSLYPICWRNREDCEPIHCIDAMPEDATEEQMYNFDYEPLSFVCSGHISAEHREINQDCYRLCFKNHCSDEMTDNDMMDLTSIISVIGAALNLDAVRKVNSGVLEIPAEQNNGKEKQEEG